MGFTSFFKNKAEKLMIKKALITGITGQDGSYLAEYLLSLGYEVHGLVRKTSDTSKFWRISQILDKLTLHSGSIENYSTILNLLSQIKPDEIYHLAAQSFVQESFYDEVATFNINNTGTHNILLALRNICPESKFYFAGSSEMYGKVDSEFQNENTRFNPRSPYAISKVFGYQLTKNYREAYGLHAVSGICFNHESPRRGLEFVTRKIIHNAVKIKLGKEKRLYLGNLNAKRDWGYAKEYVEAMHSILNYKYPQDFVIGTGTVHSVEEFVNLSFGLLGLAWEDYVVINKDNMRPAEVDVLRADCIKARTLLSWKPKYSFEDLVQLMIKSELEVQK